jgi:nitroreductase
MVDSDDMNPSDHPFFKVVEQRVSVRKYKPDPVPPEHLELILNTARLAPNSGNQQACRYLVVKDRERLDELKEACIMNREAVLTARGDEVPEEGAIRAHYDVVFSAPLYVLVLVDKIVRYKGYEEKDGSLAAANIILAARALGYGTVFYTDSIPEDLCMRQFEIPEKYSRTCIIPIGVPVSWPDTSERLPLNDVVFYERIA